METKIANILDEENLLELQEDHFNDFKSKNIKPTKLHSTFVAFANTDGGELWIGLEDVNYEGDRIQGFKYKEDANDILKVLLEETEPSVEGLDIEFIHFDHKGYILHISIPKSTKVHYTSNKKCYVRLNASSREIKADKIMHLGYSKGSLSYEKKPVDLLEINDFINSKYLLDYIKRVKSQQDPKVFLKKQRLVSKKDKDFIPNVCCALMFEEEPQATLETRCALKIYRLRTTSNEYKREQLHGGIPTTINGTIEEQVYRAKKTILDLLEDASYQEQGELVKLTYPVEAIHEILVNAIIHRDYSLNDDIHVKIYDNRIEIISPGKLPGYISLDNIYNERFSRNPNLVRMLHNLPNPVNHDIGEGLDTARNELKKVGLIAPIIEQQDNSVKVTIKHQKLASLEDEILKSLENKTQITNKEVRNLTGEDDMQKVKKAFQRLKSKGLIEPVDPKAIPFKYAWKLKNK
ncbi:MULTISPECIES: RNA-binding domain-containing protein [Bacillus]|uniref:RNA-binding domain-containing protein n=1 Tax=Bacillus TaxID=1386 RepID=UPI00077D834C|nr:MULTISPECIES: RNA-binding domain-containing protein [Bacillus]AMQ73815.1 transcriptional regulator [Bacillus amyloliquefaciens UMAF6614]AOO61319.1 transcriptional regulator [Bacillus velezensis]AWM47686.1 transcriptional regulator [Bacillus amyloliquefaciens]MBF6666175.1 putative DNA binding domain-containing protein [Bacillus velezensis]MCT6831194.1 putative DNA binding domain-containing protein [Bacillus velezensis]